MIFFLSLCSSHLQNLPAILINKLIASIGVSVAHSVAWGPEGWGEGIHTEILDQTQC